MFLKNIWSVSRQQAIMAIMSSLRITDVVMCYNGDVVAWLDQLEVVVWLKKESANLANIIPMFLEGVAYDMFVQMPVAEQSDVERPKAGLKQAFGMMHWPLENLKSAVCWLERHPMHSWLICSGWHGWWQ